MRNGGREVGARVAAVTVPRRRLSYKSFRKLSDVCFGRELGSSSLYRRVIRGIRGSSFDPDSDKELLLYALIAKESHSEKTNGSTKEVPHLHIGIYIYIYIYILRYVS